MDLFYKGIGAPIMGLQAQCKDGNKAEKKKLYLLTWHWHMQ